MVQRGSPGPFVLLTEITYCYFWQHQSVITMSDTTEMDVVYVLGSGSKWQNNEIRYSIRSVQKYLSGYRNIYVVGADPGFLSCVIHVPCNDQYRDNADGNMIHKFLALINAAGKQLSDTFIYMCDDFFLLKPIHVSEIKHWYSIDLAKAPESYFASRLWMNRLKRTRDVLLSKGLPALHFDLHLPFPFDKNRFPEIFSRYDYTKGIGYTIVSLYANNLSDINAVKLQGEKTDVFKSLALEQITAQVQVCTFMAVNDNGLNQDMKSFLKDRFPEPSKYEIMIQSKTKFQEIITWLDDPQKQFHVGLDLYVRYGWNRFLKINLQRTGDTKLNRMRLLSALCSLVSYPYEKASAVRTQFVADHNMKVSESLPSRIEDHQESKASRSYRIKKHPTVNYDKLPADLKVLYDNNVVLNREIASRHALMAASGDDAQRSRLVKEIQEMLSTKQDNWQKIDTYLAIAPKDEKNEIIDCNLAVDIQKKITAARSYISRNKSNDNPAVKEKVDARIAELKSYGITVKI